MFKFNQVFILSMFIACDSEKKVSGENKNPVAEIVSHSDGASFSEGESVTFIGSVNDGNDPLNTLETTWSLDGASICDGSSADETGELSCTIEASPEMSVITLLVVDPQEATGSASISVSVASMAAPSISLISPEGDGVYYSDYPILFSALFEDDEDLPSELLISLTSSLDGDLSLTAPADDSGELIDSLSLTPGFHELVLSAVDSTGLESSEQVSILVKESNTPPNCGITSPLPGAVYEMGSEVVLMGDASDEDIDSSMLSSVWRSSIDGIIDELLLDSERISMSQTSTLSLGEHEIVFNVEDEAEGTCETSVMIVVASPPSLTLSLPLDGSLFLIDDDISFTGILSDLFDLPTDVSLSFVSDLDGEFYTPVANSLGEFNFGYSNLSAGFHTVTATATNTIGLSSSESITIHINTLPTSPLVTISPLPAYYNDDLTVTASGSTDDDGDAVGYSYQWYKDGSTTIYTSLTVPASATSDGETWRVEVVPNDGFNDGEMGEASVYIFDSGPAVYNVMISPSVAVTGSTLVCSASGYDPTEGPLTPTYSWSVNGNNVGNTSTYIVDASETNVGDSIVCTASVLNSNGNSESITSSLVVDNTLPTVSQVSISPSSGVYNDSEITCLGTATDPDSSVSLIYSWLVSGITVGNGDTHDLATTSAMPYDAVTCYATAIDTSNGTNSLSASINVGDRAPSAPLITITPVDPVPGLDDIICSATGSTDPDGLAVSYTYSWTSSGGQSVPGSLVPGSSTVGGETWTCLAEASDGAQSSSDSLSITLADTGFAQGTVLHTNGSVVDVSYEYCAASGQCTASAAKSACTSIGKKVVSHASDGTSEVLDLGASTSCMWSISYFTVEMAMPPGACLVGVANLEFTSCCGTSRWHGNTITFGSPNTTFGYVNSNEDGYNSSISNIAGAQWGCADETTAATNYSNCSEHYVACAF